jgi:uroporphyrinogen-III synthase
MKINKSKRALPHGEAGENVHMKIAITRLRGKKTDDSNRCRSFGHECYAVSPLRAEIRTDRVFSFVAAVHENLFDCLFFTSALPAQLIAPRLTRWPRVIAIGPATARTLRHFGIECETLRSYYSRDFVPYLGDWIRGKRIGIPRADVPNPALIESIREAGGIPDETQIYALVPTGEPLHLSLADAVLFTSAMSFEKAVWTPHRGLLIMAIGESTAGVMRTRGVIPDVSGDGSLEGTLRALNEYIRVVSRSGD